MKNTDSSSQARTPDSTSLEASADSNAPAPGSMNEATPFSVELRELISQHPQVIQWQLDGRREFWITAWRIRGVEPPHWQRVIDHARANSKEAGVVVVPYQDERSRPAGTKPQQDRARQIIRSTQPQLNLQGELCLGPSFRMAWAPQDFLKLALEWLNAMGHKVFLEYERS